jgi:predicted phage terminase large subunit-like protein
MIPEITKLEPTSLFNAVEISLFKRSLYEYVKGAWEYAGGGNVFQDNWHIEVICDHLEAVVKGDIRDLIINIPPRHTKSLLTSVMFPTWVWTTEPETRFLTASHALTLAMRDALASRRLIQSPWYQQHFGDVFRLSGDQNTKGRYDNDHYGHRLATSVNSSTIGEGGDILILDDPHNPIDVSSDTQRSKDLEWIRQTWLQRKNDPATTRTILIMQRLHEDDATGHLLSEVGGFEHLMLPTEFDPKRRCQTSIGFSDPRQTHGELLWPTRYDETETTKKKRTLGSYGFAAQQQQNPAPAEGGMLKKHMWRYWCYPGQKLPAVTLRVDDKDIEIFAEELPTEFERTIHTWDMAFGKSADSDFVAGMKIGVVGANRYVTEITNDRMDINETLVAVSQWSDGEDTVAKFIEKAANGPAVVSLLKDKIPGLILVTPQEVGGSKIARVNAIVPAVEAGNVYLPHPHISAKTDDFVLQAAQFPNGAHDDMVDALTLGLIKLSGRRKRRKARIRQVDL